MTLKNDDIDINWNELKIIKWSSDPIEEYKIFSEARDTMEEYADYDYCLQDFVNYIEYLKGNALRVYLPLKYAGYHDAIYQNLCHMANWNSDFGNRSFEIIVDSDLDAYHVEGVEEILGCEIMENIGAIIENNGEL
jgi:hypothetical protein